MKILCSWKNLIFLYFVIINSIQIKSIDYYRFEITVKFIMLIFLSADIVDPKTAEVKILYGIGILGKKTYNFATARSKNITNSSSKGITNY